MIEIFFLTLIVFLVGALDQLARRPANAANGLYLVVSIVVFVVVFKRVGVEVSFSFLGFGVLGFEHVELPLVPVEEVVVLVIDRDHSFGHCNPVEAFLLELRNIVCHVFQRAKGSLLDYLVLMPAFMIFFLPEEK